MTSRSSSRLKSGGATARRRPNSAAANAASLATTATRSLAADLAWLAFTFVGLALAVSLATWSATDEAWFQSGGAEEPLNLLGRFGAYLSDVGFFFFGLSAYWWVALLLIWAFVSFRASFAVRRARRLGLSETQSRAQEAEAGLKSWQHLLGVVLFMVSSCVIEAQRLNFFGSDVIYFAGGLVGSLVGSGLDWLLGPLGVTIVAYVGFFMGLSLALQFSWMTVFESLGHTAERLVFGLKAWFATQQDKAKGQSLAEARAATVRVKKEGLPDQPPVVMPVAQVQPSAKLAEQARIPKQAALFEGGALDEQAHTSLPSVELLDPVTDQTESVSPETLAYTSRLIENRLADFGVTVRVISAQPGPVITRYEIEPALGVKGSQVVNLARDLARALSIVSVRVIETIPGKSLMGLELPNARRQTVRLSEILGSTAFQESGATLPLALGKDISGAPYVVDLARMPHLLVAGTTGSGKSVGVNAMLLSLLYHAPASRIRLILIDPKMLELSIYEGIPHLLTPVVTDMKLAANALHWCVGEMERRYRLMSRLNTRNLSSFNQKVADALRKGKPLTDPLAPDDLIAAGEAPLLEPLPQIVVVIDELADLMMVVGKKVEELIARLAQKARAAGIHLILATQRPSVDVITGLIKANIPARISFQVSSKIDSRTVLDQMGAEALLGQGDMLFLSAGTGLPIRVHGAFVADEEVLKVVEHLRGLGETKYDERILDGANPETSGSFTAGLEVPGGEQGTEADALYDQAVEVVLKHRRASISLVQRHLRIGYNRSARLLEAMEQAGLVSAMQSNGNREILVPVGKG
ncbi:MAG: DNA translocase FtsK 4TM domain-containing protein [Burkholderiaceae bacterium]|nr:DNA translocase FtsK 4TM domain-containing protein [Burkholderiaceae bacterium]